TTIQTESKHTGVLGTTVSGETITLSARDSINLIATQVVGTADVNIGAGKDITTTSAEQYDYSMADVKVKKSGIMGSGMGFMIGTKKSTDEQQGEAITQVGTKIGSLSGIVSLQAGHTIHATTTDMIGKEGVTIAGNSVRLDGKEDTIMDYAYHKERSSGLTVNLGGTVMNVANTARNVVRTTKNQRDARLKALEYVEAGKSIDSNLMMKVPATTDSDGKTVESYKALDREALKKVNVSMSIGSSSTEQESTAITTTYRGGTVYSDGVVQITAVGNSNESNSTGTIQAIGETIQGENIALSATKDIQLEAGINRQRITNDTKSKGASLGVTGRVKRKNTEFFFFF
ncbi:hemagglutinin repeat-containing protein, partial [Veillonella sp. R32]|uniref:hemagglutinin repeat-containing protein n=1 Tax=Veillonella sp. R32 TaxID=2021312 RepID=UPI00192E784C